MGFFGFGQSKPPQRRRTPRTARDPKERLKHEVSNQLLKALRSNNDPQVTLRVASALLDLPADALMPPAGKPLTVDQVKQQVLVSAFKDNDELASELVNLHLQRERAEIAAIGGSGQPAEDPLDRYLAIAEKLDRLRGRADLEPEPKSMLGEIGELVKEVGNIVVPMVKELREAKLQEQGGRRVIEVRPQPAPQPRALSGPAAPQPARLPAPPSSIPAAMLEGAPPAGAGTAAPPPQAGPAPVDGGLDSVQPAPAAQPDATAHPPQVPAGASPFERVLRKLELMKVASPDDPPGATISTPLIAADKLMSIAEGDELQGDTALADFFDQVTPWEPRLVLAKIRADAENNAEYQPFKDRLLALLDPESWVLDVLATLKREWRQAGQGESAVQ